MMLKYLVMVTLCGTHLVSSAFCDDELVLKKRLFVAAGMRAEREKLRSGHVIYSGEHASHSKDIPNYRVPVRFEYYFDHESRRFRHQTRDYRPFRNDTDESKKLAATRQEKQLPHGVTSDGQAWVTFEVGGIVVNTPEYSLYKSCDAGHVDRLPPGTAGYTSVREIDVRILGMTDWLQFNRQSTLDRCVDGFENKYHCDSVIREANSISHFRFSLFKESTLEFWIDELRGMTPIRMVRTELKEGNRESARSECTWEQVKDVWVPTAFMIRMAHKSGASEELALTLNWESVNEPLDPKVFTAAGLAESDTEIKLIIDMRLGQVVIEPAIPPSLPLPSAMPMAKTVKQVPPKPPSRLGWIVLGHLIAGGVFAWWYYRRKSRRQHGRSGCA